MFESEEVQHPAFGMVRFSNISGEADLFGSAVKHQHFISLTIMRGSYRHELGRDWYHSRGELIEVYLSASQFAELLTCMNIGSGVPCTIRHIDYVDQGRIPKQESEAKRVEKYMQDKMHMFADRLNGARAKAETILNKDGAITKTERKELLGAISSMFQEMRSNIPFYERSFAEAAEKLTQQAKTEIENFVNAKISQLGVEALKGMSGTDAVARLSGDLDKAATIEVKL